nr:unnamed protein product [Digitaria exilis]
MHHHHGPGVSFSHRQRRRPRPPTPRAANALYRSELAPPTSAPNWQEIKKQSRTGAELRAPSGNPAVIANSRAPHLIAFLSRTNLGLGGTPTRHQTPPPPLAQPPRRLGSQGGSRRASERLGARKQGRSGGREGGRGRGGAIRVGK